MVSNISNITEYVLILLLILIIIIIVNTLLYAWTKLTTANIPEGPQLETMKKGKTGT